MLNKEIKNPIKASYLIIVAVLLATTITITHARKMTVIYGGIELILAAFCFVLIFANFRKIDSLLISIAAFLTFTSFLNGFYVNDLKSVILLSLSLILPLAIMVIPTDFRQNKSDFAVAFLIGMFVIVVQSVTGILGNINSNTFGFFCYSMVAVGLIWFKRTKRKIIPLVVIVFGFIISLNSGSRNVGIVSLIVLILFLLPARITGGKIMFRVIYALAILYTIFAADIMEWAFSQEGLREFLLEYTSSFSDKSWGMEQRIVFLRQIRAKISNLGIIPKLLGEGILDHHGHNMFYQSIYIYGYVGVSLLYVFYIRIFEMAYKLVKECGDKIALGCFLSLIGMFFLNGGDVFIVGVEACSIIPQLFMGIIMLRYRRLKKAMYTKKMVNKIEKS